MYRIYQVQSGETLDRIADLFDTTSKLLREINGFADNYQVREGENIIVPNETSGFTRYIVKKGDNLYEIAKQYKIGVNELALLNGLDTEDYIYVDQVILVPKDGIEFYITKENDTLAVVANHFSTTPETLVNQNRTIYLRPDQLILYKKEKM